MQMLAVSLLLQRLKILQPALVVSLSLGIFASFCCVTLAAHAQPIAYTPIPSLRGYDFETRQSIEMACIVKKSDGPVAYGACLDQQIGSLKGTPGIPSLSGYDFETRQSIEMTCIVKKSDGPVAYGACLDQQIGSLKGRPGIPSLSGYDFETRQSIEMACIVKKSDGPVAYGACLDQQIASLAKASVGLSPNGGALDMPQPDLPAASSTKKKTRRVVSRPPALRPPAPASRFTAEKVLAIHQGMSSKKVLEMFGAPKNVSQGVCGAAVGEPWPCTHWEYGEVVHEWASFTFAERNGSLILNNFDVRRK